MLQHLHDLIPPRHCISFRRLWNYTVPAQFYPVLSYQPPKTKRISVSSLQHLHDQIPPLGTVSHQKLNSFRRLWNNTVPSQLYPVLSDQPPKTKRMGVSLLQHFHDQIPPLISHPKTNFIPKRAFEQVCESSLYIAFTIIYCIFRSAP